MTRSRAQYRARPQDHAGAHRIDTGTAEIIADDADPRGWSVVVNGVPSSYVNLDDPTRLDFEYMQWAGHVVDAMAPPANPIDAVHIGGAGCTLPLYIAAARAGSRQTVFEVDGALVTLARRTFGLRGVAGLRIRTGDGRAGLVGGVTDDSVLRTSPMRSAATKARGAITTIIVAIITDIRICMRYCRVRDNFVGR